MLEYLMCREDQILKDLLPTVRAAGECEAALIAIDRLTMVEKIVRDEGVEPDHLPFEHRAKIQGGL
jgi:hypothetical protein